eukprot:Gregarina_sp_Poly_1__5697@NODE_2_length_28028_cov_167_134223_g1_i0_p13_GENE_NODE_2_length_28028_cov_167_134223_g1_i0NODE_2_length_28028_cov_167_134223_g1_i0_p13_ORF_typecomplete_len227_score23_70THUMP/PF02926_17/0_076_NODE_2_length_28028_cov_167_134223_g1_i02237223052
MTTRRTRPWRKNTLQAQIKSSLFEGLNSCGFVVIPQHPGKWKEALRELLSLIRRVCGFEVFPPNEAPCDFQSELNKELQINRADWKFFEICKNVCFLKYPQDKASLLRPSELVIKLFEYVQQDKDEIISQAVRILPVDIMTQPKLNDVTGVLNKLLPAYFPGLKIPEITPVEEMLPTFRVSSGDTWAVRFEKRVSGRVQRDETIQAIGKILDLTTKQFPFAWKATR